MALLDACTDRLPPFSRLVGELARFHRGRLTGGEGGTAEARDAERALRELGVKDIRAVSTGLAPLLDQSDGD